MIEVVSVCIHHNIRISVIHGIKKGEAMTELSLNSTIQEVLKNNRGAEIINYILPGGLDHPMFAMMYRWPLSWVMGAGGGKVETEKLMDLINKANKNK